MAKPVPPAPRNLGAGLQALSDLQLLRRVGGQDRAAFDVLFRRFYPKLLAFCTRAVGEQTLAEEVADDAMLVVWRNAGRFKGESQVTTWVHGIAYRLCRKAMSKRFRHEQHQGDAAMEQVVDPNPNTDPAQAQAADDFTRQLARSVADLSPEHQTTVRLVSAGHSYAEVAQVMDCPENTVKTRMFYARKRLRETLAQSGDARGGAGPTDSSTNNNRSPL